MVVGAGFSGLAAALWLVRAGVKAVTLIEASNRVGGRVLSDRHFAEGRIIEAGAELIGANHPMWLELARHYGLGLSVVTSEDQYSAAGLEVPIYINGILLAGESAKDLYAAMDKVMDLISADAEAIFDPYAPWKNEGAQKLDQTSVAEKLAGWGVATDPTLWEAMRIQQGNDNVAELEKQSYLGLLALVRGGQLKDNPKAYWTETEVYRCENGNDELATKMAAELEQAETCLISMKSVVTDLEITGKGVRLTYVFDKQERVVIDADYVILATPLNTWTELNIQPQFPIANYQMQMGPAMKYLCDMSERFWIHSGEAYAPSAASDRLGMTWEGTDNQTLVGKQGIDMSLFAGGPYVMPEGDYTDEFVKHRMNEFHPGFSQHFVKGLRMYWPTVPYIGTGYSCPAPGQVCTIGQNLNQPFNGRLFFAGEQACMAYFGYMEGALQAGATAASRVLAAANLATPSVSVSVSQIDAVTAATPASVPPTPVGTAKTFRLTGDQLLVVRVVGDNALSLDLVQAPAGTPPATKGDESL